MPGEDGSETVAAVGRGHRLSIELKVSVSLVSARIVWVEIDAIAIRLPYFDDRPGYRHSSGIVNFSAEFDNFPSRGPGGTVQNGQIIVRGF